MIWRIDGTAPDPYTMMVDARLSLGGFFTYDAGADLHNGKTADNPNSGDWKTASYVHSSKQNGYILTGVYELPAGDTMLAFENSFSLQGSSLLPDDSLDWSKTSAVTLILPPGVTLSSASGVFLNRRPRRNLVRSYSQRAGSDSWPHSAASAGRLGPRAPL